MRVDLEGKVALVTGASRGIGLAIAQALADAGAGVALAARGDKDLERAVADIGPRARGYTADVRSAADCTRLVECAVSDFGRLDILINNAGVGIFRKVADMSVDEWDTVLRTNLDALFYLTHAALPALVRQGGWIINIGSLAGKNPMPEGAAYNASKFGLIGFSEALMQEVRHDGVRVSYIMPGSVATEGFRGGRAEWKIQPEDIGALVIDLLAMPDRTLPSRIEVRPSRPPRK
ncbi:MAG TPA: SDR family oxidoreductase [Longimicrobiales bacterium]|nr:SDR family oxidoreductase [Longimicrobiales bacterium]